MRIAVVTGFWEESHVGFSISGSQEELVQKITDRGVRNLQRIDSDNRSGEGPVVSLEDRNIGDFLQDATTYLAK